MRPGDLQTSARTGHLCAVNLSTHHLPKPPCPPGLFLGIPHLLPIPLPSPIGKPKCTAPGWGHFQTSSCSAHAQACCNSDTHTSHLSGAFWFTKALSMLLSNLSLATIPRQAFLSSFYSKETEGGGGGGEPIARLRAQSSFPGILGDTLGRSPA